MILRFVGKEAFGIWTLTWTILAFMEFLTLQTPSAVAVFVPKYDPEKETGKINEILNTLFVFYLVVALVFTGLFMVSENQIIRLFFKVDQPLLEKARFVLGFSFYLFIVNFILLGFGYLLTGFNIYYIYNILHIVTGVARFILFIVVLYAGFGIKGITVVQMLLIIAETILIIIFTKIVFPKLSFNPMLFSFKKLKEMLSLSVKMLVTRIAGTVNYNVDKLVLGYFLNPVVAGFYQIGSNTAKYISTLPDMLGLNSLLPAASELKARDQMHKMEMLYEKANKYMFFAALFMCAGIIIFGNDFVNLWLGPGYESVYIVMIFLAVAYTYSLLGYSAINLMNGLERVNEPMIISVAGAVINIILSIILAKKFGLTGALTGTAISMFISATAMYVLFFKLLKYRLNLARVFFKPALSILISYAVFYAVKKFIFFRINWFSFFAQVIIFSIVFIILSVFVFRHFDEYDMDLIKGILKIGIKSNLKISK
jgi:O-antigen/teichoic acid export membrane protein